MDELPREPLLSDEETNALLDAMREDDVAGQPEARATQLGSPEGPLREALGRADAAADVVAAAARTQLLRQLSRGLKVELLPCEVVPRDVMISSIDGRAMRFSLSRADVAVGTLVIDVTLARFVLERAMGASDAEPTPSLPPDRFSELDRRVVAPFPKAVVEAVRTSLLPGGPLRLEAHVDRDEGATSTRFSPMLRMALRFSDGDKRIGELVLAFDAVAFGVTADPEPAPDDRGEGSRRMAARLFEAEVDLIAVLGRAPSSVRDLLCLGAGDVLRLDGAPGQPVRLCVDDVVIALGNPVVSCGDLAIEILDRK